MAIPEGFEIVSPNVPQGFEVVPPPEPGLGAQALGVGEAALALGSAGVGDIAGGFIGGVRGATDLPPAEAQQLQEGVSDLLTFEPRTEEGKKKLRAIGENEFVKQIGNFFSEAERLSGEFGFNLLEPIGREFGIEGLGAAGGAVGASIPAVIAEAIPALKAPRLAGQAVQAAPRAAEAVTEAVTDVFQFETPTKKAITEKLQAGSTDIDVAKFKLEPSPLEGGGRAVKDTGAIEAIRQGFDEGAISPISQASAVDKQKMLKMADIAERAKKNVKFGKTNRASDVLGDSLRDRFRIVKSANTAAGKEIGKVADTLKGQPIDLSTATAGFAQSLDDLGIQLVDNGTGGFKADFSLSDVGPGSRAPLNEVIRVMNIKSRGPIDGLKAHKMKRVIDEQVTFGKVKTGIGGSMEQALKGFRSGLDDALDSTFPAYNEANVQFSETIRALDEMQSVAGTIDLFGPNAEKALGQLMRRVSGNAASRVRLLDSVNDITDIARKYENFGVGIKRIGKETTAIGDDLLDQIVFVDELERQFGAAGTTSFQGQIQQGVEQAGRALLSPKAGLADVAIKGVAKGVEKARGINTDNAFKAIKDLLRGTQQ